MEWKKLVANVAIYAGGDFLVLAVSGFLLIPLYTHHLNPAEYGILVVTRTNSEIFTYIIQFGVISAVARVYFIFRKKQEHRKYISSILIFYCISAAILFLGFGFAGKAIWRQLSPSIPAVPYMWFAFGIAFLSYIPALFSILLRVEEKAKIFVAAQLATAGLLIFFVVLFLQGFKAGLSGVLWAIVLSGFISWILFLPFLFRKLEWGFEWEHVQVSLKFGLPILISYMAYFLINRFGIIFLQRHVGLAEVGLFGFAQQLAVVISLVSVGFGKSFQPMIYATEETALADTISRMNRVYFLFMFFAAAVIVSFAPEILAVFAPRAYGSVYYVFVLLVIANMTYSLKLMSESVILYRHHPNLSMALSIGGGILSVLGNVWLVPQFGVNGAVFSSLFTAGVVTGTSLAIARRMVPFRIGMYVVWTGIAAVAAVVFAVWMNGRVSMLLLVPLKIALISLLGVALYFLHLRRAIVDAA
ncbi:MAG: oligosaccharide flippase family protein [Terracidiphilus sp.]|nr:oligosaccharide flippase family protein [Terracidiphilus sp.]